MLNLAGAYVARLNLQGGQLELTLTLCVTGRDPDMQTHDVILTSVNLIPADP